MTKHIIGIIIFSFIIATSAIIGSLFYTIPTIEPVHNLETGDQVYKKKKKRCRPRENSGDPATVKINQAVFNLNNNRLDTSILLEREDDSTESADVALHFFVSDKYSTRFLATEFVAVSPNLLQGNNKSQIQSNSFSWLNNLQSRENLYIIPEIAGDRYSYQKHPPNFNPLEATAISVKQR